MGGRRTGVVAVGDGEPRQSRNVVRSTGAKLARRTSRTPPPSTAPSTSSYPSSASIRPRRKIGRAFPYQSTHDALHLSATGSSALDASAPSRVNRRPSFLRNTIDADPSTRCSHPGRPGPRTGSPRIPAPAPAPSAR